MYRSRISPVLASVTINQLGGMIPDDVDEVKIVYYSKNDKDEMNHFSNLYHMTHRPQNGADPNPTSFTSGFFFFFFFFN